MLIIIAVIAAGTAAASVRLLRTRQLRVTDPDATVLDVSFMGGPYSGQRKRTNAAPRVGAVIPAFGGTWIGLTRAHGAGVGHYQITEIGPDGATASWHPTRE